MQDHDIHIRTRDGNMSAFVAHPDGDGPFPAVIFYMDAPGFREELKDMARRIACAGYYCVLPDLYYRLGLIRLDFDRTQASHMAAMFAVRKTITNDLVAEDTGAILAHLDATDKVRPGAVGGVGHCMSGSYILTVAARYASRFAAAAAFYGTQMITDQPDSPHHLIPQIKAEIYLSFAENDEYVPDDVPPRLQMLFAEHDIGADVEIVPGTSHAYCFPERPAYHPEAAEAGWLKLKALFDRNLL